MPGHQTARTQGDAAAEREATAAAAGAQPEPPTPPTEPPPPPPEPPTPPPEQAEAGPERPTAGWLERWLGTGRRDDDDATEPFLPPEPEQAEQAEAGGGLLALADDLAGTDRLVARIAVHVGQLGELDRARGAERAEVRRAIHHARLLARVIIPLTQPGSRLADPRLLRELADDAQAWAASAATRAG